MSAMADGTLGERVAELRRRRGLSQRDLAVEVGRSESWVSQVERDVLPVERMSVLRSLADALGASIHDLRPEAIDQESGADDGKVIPIPDLNDVRYAITGHQALDTLLGTRLSADPGSDPPLTSPRSLSDLQFDVDED